MKRYATLIVSLVLLAALTMPAFAHRTFTESFTTTTYEDTTNTTADWDTTSGELKLPPFTPTLVGSYGAANHALGVAVEGNHVFVADSTSGLQIIDISDPSNPTLAGSYTGSGQAYHVAVDGDHAFIANGTAGVRILDISDPTNPTLVGNYAMITGAQNIAVDGNQAFVVGAALLSVLDVSNAASPSLVGYLGLPGTASGVTVDGNHVFVADGSSGLLVIDVSNPASPALLGSYATPGNAIGVAVDGNQAFVADDASGLQIIDVSDPSNPILSGSYDTPGPATEVAVSGDVAFIADGSSGLLMIDVSDPTAPTLASTYGTPGIAFGVSVAGNLAFAADDTGGVQVVRTSDPIAPTLAGTYITPGQTRRVAVAGNLAFVTDFFDGLEIVDISDPTNPTLAGHYHDSLTGPEPVAVAGDIAYYGSAADGVQILDISDPTNPTLVTQIVLDATGLAVAGDLLFVSEYTQGLNIFDVSDPASPAFVGQYYINSNYSIYWYGVAVAGDHAFLAKDDSLLVIDVSNPTSPALLGSYAMPEKAIGVTVDGNQAYVADGLNGLQIIDVSDPANPTLSGSYATPSEADNVAVDGDLAFVADFSGGLLVIDISDPTNPTLAGTYQTSNESQGVAVAGDYAFLADGYGGLKAVQVYQHKFGLTDNTARSLPVDGTNDVILRARLSSTQTPDVSWELSANGGAGYSLQSFTPGAGWTAFTTPGTDLVWHSTLAWAAPGGPSVSSVTIDWLNEFAQIMSINDIPNDQGGWVRVNFERSGYDFADEASSPITSYGIWRRVDNAALLATLKSAPQGAAPGSAKIPADMTGLPLFTHGDQVFVQSTGQAQQAAVFPSGTWELVQNVPAIQTDNYIAPIPTEADSTVSGTQYTVVVVTAHTTTPSIWYTSAPDSGYSVDNLAPSVPANFVVAYNTGSGNTLSWDKSPDADFQYFRVYRSIDPNFTPGPGNLVQSTTSPGWVDPDNNGGGVYYKVTATDFAGNESDPASPGTTTGVQKPAVPTTFALFQNVPNPFNPETTIRYDVARGGGNVTVAIYDVGGRLVKTLVDEHESAGQKSVVWDGRNDAGQTVATGTYFCRLSAPGFTQTRKMVLLK